MAADRPEADEAALSDRAIHDRDLAWLARADAVVAETTVPSLGVGYEIARAALAGIPVLALFREGDGRSLSAMIAGCPEVAVTRYVELPEALDAVKTFLRGLAQA